ncbi:Phosphoribosylanthranilate isomerase [Candidatus Vidania fulgoroideae]|nr:Phosphoribosylanthranilate isomerase [Candidatus Vidania fulgoroideae]
MKNRVLIKFCGLKKREDFLNCISLKIDAVGFVFYKKNNKFVSFKKAKRIVKGYEDVSFPQKIGVFHNPKISLLKRAEKENFIDLYQIGGNKFNKKIKKYLKKKKKKYIRSFRLSRKNSFNIIRKVNKSNRKLFFINSYTNKKKGSKKDLPWKYINFIKKKIFISGKIGIKNVKNILSYNPFGIDLSSEIEKSNGSKSFKKMKKIVRLVNEL